MNGAERLRRLTGRLMALATRAVRRSDGRGLQGVAELDKTGISVRRPERLRLLWKDADLLVPVYEHSVAQTLWRAQEFSLFQRHCRALQSPLLDFGCGDGSFAAALFQKVDYGLDIDPEALKVARAYGLYGVVMQAGHGVIPIQSGCMGTIVSNSVLEHVIDLKGVMAEIRRVLTPSGLFIFTVPVQQFAEDVEAYLGRAEAHRLNAEFYHRNLLRPPDWEALLAGNGFDVVHWQSYQPARFTYVYLVSRLFGNRGLGRLVPQLREFVWAKFRHRFIEMIRDSVTTTEQGGNLFVIARKCQ